LCRSWADRPWHRPSVRQRCHSRASEITASAFAVPRGRLLDPHRKKIKDSVTVKQPLSGTDKGGNGATVSGTYIDHIAITLKRLTLKR
jgi:hypothetical protein